MVTIQLNSNDKEAKLIQTKLYDIFGKVILTQPANGNSQALDTSAYSKGVYFIEAKDGVTTYYQKIIIQ